MSRALANRGRLCLAQASGSRLAACPRGVHDPDLGLGITPFCNRSVLVRSMDRQTT